MARANRAGTPDFTLIRERPSHEQSAGQTLGLVQRAVELNFQDRSYNHIWPYFTLFYVAGPAVARKRYR